MACDQDKRRLEDLFEIGIDEIAWRGGQRYLTLVTDHRRGKVVWGAEGRSAAVADRFFADLDPQPGDPQPGERRVGPRAAKLTAISLDMGPGYAKSAREHAPQAVICIDPYHVVAVRHEALLVRAGCKTPPLGCRGSPVKLRTV